MLKVQVLAACMHKKNIDDAILEMNLQSDAIIINQCDRNDIEEKEINGNKIKMYSYAERGVGVSRNNALLRADSDIVAFADEDIKYEDGYPDIINDAFSKHPDADMIVFNVPSLNINRQAYTIKSEKKINKFNCSRYGAVRFVVKLDSLRRKNIFFSLLFGGGAKYGSGEDSLFIMECVKKGFRIYSNPAVIGHVKQDGSTWFKGYNEKFFVDKGALYACLFPKFTNLFCLQLLIRRRKIFLRNEIKLKKAYNLMKTGARGIKK